MIINESSPSPVGRSSTLNTDDGTPAHCRRCGSTEVIVTRCETGPHFATIRCSGCGWHGFAKTPWSLGRAVRFVIPFGRHKGLSVGELAQTKTGRRYLAWLADNDRGNTGTAARILIDYLFNACCDGPSLNEKPCGGEAPHGLRRTTPASPKPGESS
jgi:predicted RNA-binding Zn-ribbon protein involved in translation (DUF1610 family)